MYILGMVLYVVIVFVLFRENYRGIKDLIEDDVELFFVSIAAIFSSFIWPFVLGALILFHFLSKEVEK